MARKKWTPKTEITDAVLKFREKRKWQLSYRRYVLERKPSIGYSHFFGLDIETLRNWFENQFTPELNWENYADAWQFDHIVPATYFDYSNEHDMRLCWSFINMRVEKLDLNKNRGNRIDLLAVKPYFQVLYEKTGFALAIEMINKISQIEISNIECDQKIEAFLIENKSKLENIMDLEPKEFHRLNEGTSLEDILLEREMMRKFG